MNDFRLVAAGDAALVAEFADRIDSLINERAIGLAERIATAKVPGVLDIVPTYRSVAVYFDPLRTDYDLLVARMQPQSDDGPSEIRTSYADTTPVRVPVCYEGDFAPDLAAVAAFGGIAEAEAVRLHTSRVYRVFMLGFVAGFAYMGIVDDRIAVPRLSTPRMRVPAGSVGIAGGQTGIYPVSVSGGWQIIGRTPIKPFDPSRADPFLFKPGDAVQFYAVRPAEYASLENAD